LQQAETLGPKLKMGERGLPTQKDPKMEPPRNGIKKGVNPFWKVGKKVTNPNNPLGKWVKKAFLTTPKKEGIKLSPKRAPIPSRDPKL